MFSRVIWIASLLSTSALLADDWPQWMGPNRDGIYREEGVIQQIPSHGLPVLWRTPIAGGYTGPAVASGRVYTLDFERETGEAFNDPGRRAELQGRERILCHDLKTGKLLWKFEYPCTYKISYPAGPRATPTVAHGLVCALGAEGHLHVLNAETGELVWSKYFPKDYNAPTPIWGFAGHPLVYEHRLYCTVGGPGSVLVAFDLKTGRELWRAIEAEEQGYCPPTLIHVGGVHQLILWDPEKLNSVNPVTGEVYWTHPLKPNYGMSIMAPRQAGNYLFASGIGKVAALFELDQHRPAVRVVWRGEAKTAVYAANTTPIIDGDTIYGVDCDTGMLTAVDLMTGRRLWETAQPTTGDRRAAHGTAFFVKNHDQYFLFSETGDLILAKLTRSQYQEIGRFHILEPTGECFGRNVVWSHPAFAERRCVARNDRELVCVSLSATD